MRALSRIVNGCAGWLGDRLLRTAPRQVGQPGLRGSRIRYVAAVATEPSWPLQQPQGIRDQGGNSCRSTSSRRPISATGSRDSARRAARPAGPSSKRRAPASGGKLDAFYYAFGGTELVTVMDLPNNVTAAGVALLVAASGRVDVKTTVLLTAEEVDAAVKVTGDYRPPG